MRLGDLGWGEDFAAGADAATLTRTPPVRVTQAHRTALRVLGEGIERTIPLVEDATVGDWLLLDADDPRASRLLPRRSVIRRRAAGAERRVQIIAANVDTVFITTSCNAEFNVARLERYLALVFDAGIEPVIVLTKPDLTESPEPFVEAAQAVAEGVAIIALDARDPQAVARLAPWCGTGRTVAFLGSSGVGKSTLTNALIGSDAIETQAVRETDDRGRHTTTRRELHVVPGGCVVLDTPGMRELQLTDAADGIGQVFDDLAEIATHCRFRDCSHGAEPGCAINEGIARGTLDPDRVARWRKLVEEDILNSADLGRKAGDRSLKKRLRAAQKKKQK